MGNTESRNSRHGNRGLSPTPTLEDRVRIYEREWMNAIRHYEESRDLLREKETQVATLTEQNTKLHEELMACQELVRKSLSQVERYRKRAHEYLNQNDELLKALAAQKEKHSRVVRSHSHKHRKKHHHGRPTRSAPGSIIHRTEPDEKAPTLPLSSSQQSTSWTPELPPEPVNHLDDETESEDESDDDLDHDPDLELRQTPAELVAQLMK